MSLCFYGEVRRLDLFAAERLSSHQVFRPTIKLKRLAKMLPSSLCR
jgi:hypothetical protein